MRLLLVSDLDPAAVSVDWSAGDRRRTFENADANAWLDELRPTIEVSVPNSLTADSERISFELTIDSMQAFSPSGVISRIPALSAASKMREALAEAQSGSLSCTDLQARLVDAGMLPETAADLVRALEPGRAGVGEEGSDEALSRLLGMVDVGGGDGAAPRPENPAEAALDAFVGAVASGTAPEVDVERAGRAIGDLDKRLGEQLEAIYTDPEFRRLEAAWRGLKFVLDRADFRQGMRIEALACKREDLAEVVRHQILEPEYVGGAEKQPLAAVVLDFAFGASPPDIDALSDLAATGASLQVPFVAAADADFFGFDKPTDLSRLGPLRQHLATEEYIGFRKLREMPDGQFLCLSLPSFLLRDASSHEALQASGELWGNGALLVAGAILGSHAQTEWPTHVGSRKVDDLVVRKTRMGALPAAVSFADRLALDLAEFGFFAFRAPLNRDHVVSSYPAMVKRVGPQEGEEAHAQATLPAALFSALAAHRVLRLQAEMTSEDADATAVELERRMRSFLGSGLDDGAVTIQHLQEHDDEENRVFGIRLRPPTTIVPNPFGLVLGATIPRQAN